MNAALTGRRFWLCLLSVTAVILLAEGAGLVRMHRTAERAGGRWKAKLRERNDYGTQSPAPTKENAVRLETNLAAVRLALVGAAAKLQADEADPASGEAGGGSATATDTFFELAAFAARIRQRAEKEGITLKSGERFGFSAYAEEPPTAEMAPLVLRQRRWAETLLSLLFDARPESLVSFQRERPTPGTPERIGVNRVRPATPNPSGMIVDYFTLDPQRSLRRSGMVEGTAFRMVFTGFTGTLRSFLNDLAAAPLPLVVRSVEVTHVSGGASTGAPRQLDRSASLVPGDTAPMGKLVDSTPVAVVVPAASTYTVVVEVVNFIGKVPDKLAPGSRDFG